MNRRVVRLPGVLALAVCLATSVHGQISLQPTPPPDKTAESQGWYQRGEPIPFAGTVYYPAGPTTHFLRNEMVLSGAYDGIPIYTRTTQEPRSVIYVPLPGGLMKPYERRRSGDLAGTVGSTAPSFPVVLPSEETTGTTPPRAPAPPTGTASRMTTFGSEPLIVRSPLATTAAPHTPPMPPPAPVATSGTVMTAPARRAGAHAEAARRPVRLNGVFVDYDNARWFAEGPASEYDAQRFTRIGDYRGFPVFRDDRRDVIYISPVAGVPALVVPYSRR